MITAGYVVTMAAYNAEMNRRLYDAASRLTDAARREQRGAFWESIHGTLNHLLWGDRVWMARFDGWERPPQPIRESAGLIDDFATLLAAREVDDARLQDWAGRVTDAWLAEDQTWLSGSAGREMRRPRALLVAHLFNHQTHHRGPGPCDADRGGRADRRYRPVSGSLAAAPCESLRQRPGCPRDRAAIVRAAIDRPPPGQDLPHARSRSARRRWFAKRGAVEWHDEASV